MLMHGEEMLDLIPTKEEAIFWYLVCKGAGMNVHLKRVSWRIAG